MNESKTLSMDEFAFMADSYPIIASLIRAYLEKQKQILPANLYEKIEDNFRDEIAGIQDDADYCINYR